MHQQSREIRKWTEWWDRFAKFRLPVVHPAIAGTNDSESKT